MPADEQININSPRPCTLKDPAIFPGRPTLIVTDVAKPLADVVDWQQTHPRAHQEAAEFLGCEPGGDDGSGATGPVCFR